MTGLIKLKSAEPSLVEVEALDATPGPPSVARRSAIDEELGERFETAIAGLLPTIETILCDGPSLPRTPGAVEVRFAINPSGERDLDLACSAAAAYWEIRRARSGPNAA
jgi:hypothetical protein